MCLRPNAAETETPRSLVLLWDGRLDNRPDLERMIAAETRSTPADDGSLVRQVYEQRGIAGLGHVIGDWSVVIHDPGRAWLACWVGDPRE